MITTRLSAVITLFLILAIGSCAGAFTGDLSNSFLGGLNTTDNWGNGSTSMSWNVSFNNNTWTYSYKLVVPKTEVSHFILETSCNFTRSDMTNLKVISGKIGSVEVGTFKAPPACDPDKQPDPYMPCDIYGIKFDDASGKVLEFSFDSLRRPVWGDFYAKGGKESAVYNWGFALPDPSCSASNGSLLGHILVPDTLVTSVPEPASLLACLGGLLGLVLRRRSK